MSDEVATVDRTLDCPHCGEFHEVEVVAEYGWEPQVYCRRTGVLG